MMAGIVSSALRQERSDMEVGDSSLPLSQRVFSFYCLLDRVVVWEGDSR